MDKLTEYQSQLWQAANAWIQVTYHVYVNPADKRFVKAQADFYELILKAVNGNSLKDWQEYRERTEEERANKHAEAFFNSSPTSEDKPACQPNLRSA